MKRGQRVAKIFLWMCAKSVTPSTPESKKWLIPVAESTASTSALVDGPSPSKERLWAVLTTALMLSAAPPVAAYCPPPDSFSPPMAVHSVTDGDTIRLESGQRVRIPGMNTFELKDSGWRKSMADQAKRHAETIIDTTVVLSPWPARKDRYGRLLANVWLGDQYVSESLLRAGLALVVTVPPDDRLAGCLQKHERDARAEKRGLWVMGRLPASLSQLTEHAGGFQYVKGRVTAVAPLSGSLVILDGQLAVRWPDSMDLPTEGSVWLVRGWLSRSRGRTRAYADWFVRAQDPRNLERGF